MAERRAWTGIVLAGGRSRRFGGVDKARLPLRGQTLLDRSLDTLRLVTTTQLVVGRRPGIADRHPDAGPLGGLLTALHTASTSHVLVVACDLPFLTASFLAALQRVGLRTTLGIVHASDARMALCLTLRRDACLDEAWDRGVRRMQELPDLLPHVVMPAVEVRRHDPRRRLLMNVNDPLTYAWALAEAEHD